MANEAVLDLYQAESGLTPASHVVVATIRLSGAQSQAEVRRMTGLSKAVISDSVRRLIAAGLVMEAESLPSAGGRKATRIQISDAAAVVAAVEIGVGDLGLSLHTLDGAVVAEQMLDLAMDAGPQAVLDAASGGIRDLLTSAGADRVLVGCGVGVAAPVEFATGCAIHPPVNPDWHGVPVRSLLAEALGVPCVADNEVNAMALAELRAGMARGEQDALVVKVGTWTGAGLISGGAIHRGHKGSAGSLRTTAGGHDIAVRAERTASEPDGTALAEAAKDGPLTASVVARLAMSGDPAAVRIITEAAESVGDAVAICVDFFNPSLVVVAGGLAESEAIFLAQLRSTIYERSLPLATQDLRIQRSELGRLSARLGAAYLILDELFRPDRISQLINQISRGGTR